MYEISKTFNGIEVKKYRFLSRARRFIWEFYLESNNDFIYKLNDFFNYLIYIRNY